MGAVVALLLGAGVYGGQALCLTLALDRSDASLVAVLFGTYPAFVVVLLTFGGRRHVRPWLLVPMAGVLAGSTLLVARAPSGAIGVSGVALALASAGLFAVFVIASNALVARVDPVALATLCCLGAVVSVLGAGAAAQRLDFDFDPTGWVWMAAAGTISTAVAFLALFRSLPAMGPAPAGIVLGAEPLVTVALAVAFLGDELMALQLAGAGLVVVSVGILHRRSVETAVEMVA